LRHEYTANIFIIILEIFFSELKFTKWLYKTYMESHIFRFSLFETFVFIAPGFLGLLGIKIQKIMRNECEAVPAMVAAAAATGKDWRCPI